MARRTKDPVEVFVNFAAGGGPAGITAGITCTYIEDYTHSAISALAKGGHGTSAGATGGSLLYIKDEERHDRPRYTASQASEIFTTEFQIWVQNRISFLKQHLKSVFMKHAEGLYFDETLVEDSIDRYIGNATLADVIGDFAISAHNGSAAPSEEAILFSRIKNRNTGLVEFSHDPNLTLLELIRGTTAVPGVYKSKSVKDLGELSDFGHVYSANRAFQRFKRCQLPGTEFHFIELGGPRYSNLSPDKVNASSILGLIFNGYLARGTSNHSYSDGIQTIGEDIGFDRVHEMTPFVDTGIISDKLLPSQNILDASKANIKLLEEFSWDHIEKNKDKFNRLCDFLGENLALKQKPSFIPSFMTQKKEPSQRSGFLGLFTGIKQPVTATPS